MKISVIVVNWNRRRLLQDCLQSLIGQQDAELEIVVVDNGSTDGSVEFLNEFRSSITCIFNDKNLGFCAANNQGIRAASGELIGLLNNDAVADPRWAHELAQPFSDPDVGMAASKILVHGSDPPRIDKVGHLIYPDGQNRGRGTGEIDRGQYDRPEDAAWPDGCAAMYRRSMLDEIGLLDEDFFAYADDAELGLRARIAGWRCRYVPGAVVWHHRGMTLGVASARRVTLIERNRVLLAAKLFPWRLLIWNPVYFAARLAAGIVAAARGEGETRRFPGAAGKLTLAWAMLKGDFAALRLLPRMLAKRKEIHRFRKLNAKQVVALIRQHRIGLAELSRRAN